MRARGKVDPIMAVNARAACHELILLTAQHQNLERPITLVMRNREPVHPTQERPTKLGATFERFHKRQDGSSVQIFGSLHSSAYPAWLSTTVS